MLSREEHLKECKCRALEYWRAGDLENACCSMISDLEKHKETRTPAFSPYLLALGIIYVTRRDYDGLEKWIRGFR